MAIADELIALLGFELTGEDAAKRYEGTLKRLEKTAERVGAAIGTGMKIAAAAAAGGMALLGRSVINTSAEFEKYQATLEIMEGSAEAAKRSLDWVAEFAKKTPYDVAGVTQAFVKLKAYGIDPIANESLRVLGDTASGMGKTLNDAVEMFADASGMEFERLKEFGLRAKQEGDNVTFVWSKNGEELTKTVKKNSEEVRKFILENLGERFGGAMDKQSKTFNGIMSNLGETWVDFQRRIGDAGFFDLITSKMEGLLNTIERLDQEGKLDEWAQAVSDTLSWFANVFGTLATRVGENIRWMADNFDQLKPIIYTVAAAFGLLLIAAFPITSAFILIGLAVDDLMAYLQGGESVIGDFIDWCSKLPAVLNEAAGAFGTWLANIDWGQLGRDAGALLVDAIVMAIVGSIALLGLWAQWVRSVDWDNVAQIIINGIVAGLQAAIEYFYNFWVGVGTRIAEIVKEWFNIDLAAVGAQLGTSLMNGLRTIGGAIKSWFLSLFTLPDWVPGFGGGAGAVPGVSGPQEQSALDRLAKNAMNNIDRAANDNGVPTSMADNRQDNRQLNAPTNVTINQTVTQPAAAPAAAARATGSAVSGAVAAQRSQIETEPSF